MRNVVVSSIAALAAIGFSATAHADGDCGWGHTAASISKPIATSDAAKPLPLATIPTKKTLPQTAKATKTEKVG